MSNSVVTVTDSALGDSLLLLVGEDGTVTPSREVVDTYLNSKTSATNLQVMHINSSDSQSIEVNVDNMLYVPDSERQNSKDTNFDEIAYNLYNIQLDHDYTSQCEPPEEDELAKTLSMLDGSEGENGDVLKTPENRSDDNIKDLNQPVQSISKPKPKSVSPPTKQHSKTPQKKKIKYPEKDGECTKNKDDDVELESKLKGDKRIIIKQDIKIKESPTKTIKSKLVDDADVRLDKSPQEAKSVDKKQIKKDRRPPKPVLEDFALFSTPDIIRRVGGKDSAVINSPVSPAPESTGSDIKPAKVETRSKSVSDSPQSFVKLNRLSLDGNVFDKQCGKMDKTKEKKLIPDFKLKKNDNTPKTNIGALTKMNNENNSNVEPTTADNNSFVATSYEKSFNSNLSLETEDLGCNEQNINLDANSLDLDPTLLDNINSDLISEDMLYEVAQSLVSNTELQNAIDKSLSEESLGLESAVQLGDEHENEDPSRTIHIEKVSSTSSQKGTQIVRPDGRIVVIPPIERPTTRSRNKKKEEEKHLSKSDRLHRKPLDDEHVSGNELDSSGEEEESEDDPNKLWCICNQPHNNRFMICCDTCEEWYHGKCVNITKAMGQQMESEGKEWICLFCKDPMLKRPQAAAKRIRKASRNSRQSSDSTGSTQLTETKSSSVPCVVCQKPSRNNSIFCSEACILVHAQGVERVVVFERSTGNMLTGNKAPSAANLEQWLKDHPGYEVVRSAGKIVTTKQPHISASKIKIIKTLNIDNNQNKNNNSGMKPVMKNPSPVKPTKASGPTFKIISKQVSSVQPKEKSNTISPTKESSGSIKIKPQTPIKSGPTPPTKDKPVVAKISKSRHHEQSSSSTSQAKQENIRENVEKTIFEQLTNRLNMVDDLKLSEEELRNISIEIETQLYKCFGDTGQKYRNKYRSLIFNIKDTKNQTLWRRICEKSINPYQLVRLSPDDLASQELALWREREAKHQLDMIKKSELELLQCNRQYVLKTHKGEQILEDNRPTDHIDNTEVITSLTDGSSGEKSDRKRDSSKDNDRRSSKHSYKDKERKTKERNDNKSGHHRHRSPSRDHDRSRKRSRSRDRTSKHNDKRRSRSRGRDRHKRSSHKSSRHKRETHRGSSTDKLDKKSKEILEQLVDNKIVPPLEDRLWKHVPQEDILPAPSVESDSDHEPTSTVTIPTPPRNSDVDEFSTSQSFSESKNDKFVTKEQDEVDNVTLSPKTKSDEIWRGIINMIDVAQISITAHEVSGDCHGLSGELPANLDIVGRISPDTVWDYIGKMKCSNSKIISIVRLNAINDEEKMPYLALYSYLSSRNRLGVVKSTNKAVKDFYILPLASQKPIPQALLPLNGPGFEESRPPLLLGIIIRDKRKRPSFDPIPVVSNVKKPKLESSLPQASPPLRSYTPPPIPKDSKLKLPLPPSIMEPDGDEPYSPEDSDPEVSVPATESSVPNNPNNFLETDVGTSQAFQPFVNKFNDIPGLDSAALPSSTQEIQRQMEKLNKEIEMQKSEINSISQNIATASTEIGSTALANIALPSNLQQILDSIKTIGSTPSGETIDTKAQDSVSPQENSDFTIPLMLPTTFSRQLVTSTSGVVPENTIPLNLPTKKKCTSESDKSSSVLSSLSEEDLIKKAEEMLVEDEEKSSTRNVNPTVMSSAVTGSHKLSNKVELSQPKIPGLEDETF